MANSHTLCYKLKTAIPLTGYNVLTTESFPKKILFSLRNAVISCLILQIDPLEMAYINQKSKCRIPLYLYA